MRGARQKKPRLAHTRRHGIGKHKYDHANLFAVFQVSPHGKRVAYALNVLLLAGLDHAGGVFSVCKIVQPLSPFAKPVFKRASVRVGKLSNRKNTHPIELALCSAPDVKQLLRRQRPHRLPEIVGRNDGNGVGLVHIASKLCKHLVPGHAYAYRKPQLLLYPPAYCVRNFLAARLLSRFGHVKPAFVYAERFYFVRIVLVNPPYRPRNV